MNTTATPQHSAAWVSFTYASFLASAGMTAIGILFLPAEIWVKAYLAMGTIMLVQSCVTLTKTLRDREESSRLLNRIEDAKTEQLLMRIDRSKE